MDTVRTGERPRIRLRKLTLKGDKMKKLIFKTVHGSHLYGTAHEGSDRDIYEVYEGSETKLTQRVSGQDDVVRGDLEAFLLRALSGSHQSLETLFSPVKEWEPGMEEKYGAFLSGLRVTGRDVFEKYERTIKTFCYGDFKRRRHAVRLNTDLRWLRRTGRFNPQMDEFEVLLSLELASRFEGEELWGLLSG